MSIMGTRDREKASRHQTTHVNPILRAMILIRGSIVELTQNISIPAMNTRFHRICE